MLHCIISLFSLLLFPSLCSTQHYFSRMMLFEFELYATETPVLAGSVFQCALLCQTHDTCGSFNWDIQRTPRCWLLSDITYYATRRWAHLLVYTAREVEGKQFITFPSKELDLVGPRDECIARGLNLVPLATTAKVANILHSQDYLMFDAQEITTDGVYDNRAGVTQDLSFVQWTVGYPADSSVGNCIMGLYGRYMDVNCNVISPFTCLIP